MVGVRSLDEKGKSRIAEMLVRLNSGGGAGPLGAMEGLQKVGERLRVLSQGRGGPFPLPDVDLGGEQMRKGELVTAATTIGEEGEGYGKQATTIGEEEEYRKRATTIGEEGEGYREEPGIPAAHPAPSFDALQLEHQVQPSHRQDSDFTSSLGPPGITGIPMIPLPSVEDLKTTLLSSYREFRSSISRVVSLPFPSAESTSKHRDETTTTPVDESRSSPEEEDELVLSKTQCELTLEEGRVWDELTLATTTLSPSVGPTLTGVSTPIDTTTLPPPSPATPLTPPTPPTPAAPSTFALDTFVFRAAEDRLDALRTRSEVIADSYQRRMCAPTRNTYLESKEILEAMGVLCHEIEGEPHEGEALASSLVLRGLADYVVSEDSVGIFLLDLKNFGLT
jgi:flap endonuclease-1